MKDTVVFDFDGVIADTLELVIEFGNANQKRFAKKKITKDDFRHRSMREALTHIGLPLYKLPQFVKEVKNHINVNLSSVKLFSGLKELIEEISTSEKKLYILSSNSKQNIETVLSKNNILQCFQAIHSDSSLFGKHRTLSRLFSTYKLNKQNSLYIGDEIRDLDACKKLDVDFIAVSWGYDSLERLKKANVSHLANSVNELKSFVTNYRL